MTFAIMSWLNICCLEFPRIELCSFWAYQIEEKNLIEIVEFVRKIEETESACACKIYQSWMIIYTHARVYTAIYLY